MTELPIVQGVPCAPVPGFPLYAVAQNGTVWSSWRKRWKELRTRTDRDGYKQIGLWKNGKQHFFKIHALVLIAFRGPRRKGMQARHLDGDQANCCLENLVWGTASENAIDKVTHGTSNLLKRGQNHPQGKLTDDDVALILAACRVGLKRQEIAATFGVTRRYISQIFSWGGRDPRRRHKCG